MEILQTSQLFCAVREEPNLQLEFCQRDASLRIQTLTLRFMRSMCCSVRGTEIASCVLPARCPCGIQSPWKRPVEVPKSFLEVVKLRRNLRTQCSLFLGWVLP